MQISLVQGGKVDHSSSHTVAKHNVNTYSKDGKLRTVAGLTEFAALTGKDRNGFFINSGTIKDHFRVIGNQLIAFDFDGSPDIKSPTITIEGKDRVKFDATIQNLIFCAGGNYYLYNDTWGVRQCSTLSSKTESGYFESTNTPIGDILDLTYIKQTVILLVYGNIPNESPPKKGVMMWQSFPQLDETFVARWDIDDTDPDRSVAIESETDYFILFNKRTITFWYAKIDDPDKFSFLPAESKQIEGGIINRDHKARLLGTWALLSITVPNQEPNIYVIGSTLQAIGTIEIQNIIKRYSEDELTLTVLESYQQDGIDMLFVHLPHDTLLYNSSNQVWTILQSKNSRFEITEYRAINMVRDERSNKFIVGDKFENRLGILDQTIGNEYGIPISQVIFSPYQIWNDKIRHLAINGNFGEWPYKESPLIRIQLTQGGINYGKTLAIHLPAGRHYNSVVSFRGLGRVQGKTSIRMEIDTIHTIEFDDRLYINEDADAVIGL